MNPEPQKILLGVLDVSQDEAIALDIPPGADADAVRAAIDKANAERRAETKALREVTGLDADKESGK